MSCQPRSDKLAARWKHIECGLRFYAQRCSPGSWGYFRYREGRWLFFLTVLLLGAGFIAALHACAPPAILVVTVALAADILLVNTAIVFITGSPVHPLRSALFTIVAYFDLALAFSPIWILLSDEEKSWQRLIDGIYQSLRSLATVGPSRSWLPTWAKAAATIELLIGIYFLVMVFAIYASWAKAGSGGMKG